MQKLCMSDESISSEEALSTAVRTFNQRDVIRGFSPVQHALGRTPDETGRIIDATQLKTHVESSNAMYNAWLRRKSLMPNGMLGND